MDFAYTAADEAFRDELVDWLDEIIVSVYPSGGDFAAISTPIVPFAPGRLSTITGWPQACVNFCAIARAVRSVPPPATKGTIKRMGLEG